MRLIDQQLAEGKMLAILPDYRDMVRKAHDDIRRMLQLAPSSYVSVSWGKQSVCMAHLVYFIAPETPMVHWSNPDAELIADFAATRDTFLARWPIAYTEFPQGDTDLFGNGRAFLREHAMTGLFMGLAADESKGRNQSLQGGRKTIMQYADGTWRCCPVAAWRKQDLAAYIAAHDLPLLAPYRRYGLGVRTATGVTPGTHGECGIDYLNSTNRGDLSCTSK